MAGVNKFYKTKLYRKFAVEIRPVHDHHHQKLNLQKVNFDQCRTFTEGGKQKRFHHLKVQFKCIAKSKFVIIPEHTGKKETIGRPKKKKNYHCIVLLAQSR